MRPISLLQAFAALSLASAPALADPAPVASETVRSVRDPNQRICETVTEIGSRLATKKVCATRAEWAEMRKHDRESVEEMQRLQGRPCVNVPMGKGTGVAPVC